MRLRVEREQAEQVQIATPLLLILMEEPVAREIMTTLVEERVEEPDSEELAVMERRLVLLVRAGQVAVEEAKLAQVEMP